MFFSARNAKEIRTDTSCNDEFVVAYRLPIGQMNGLGSMVHAVDQGIDKAEIALLEARRSQKPGDVTRIQHGGRDLIQQWLKSAVVMAVNKGDVDLRMS